jgi:hypothetical protein
MTFRAVWLVVVLVGIAGCEELDPPPYPYRGPCPEGETCCPPGSHEAIWKNPRWIICAPDEPPCADAGADGGACPEAGTDAP